jgi:hypothetical protein
MEYGATAHNRIVCAASPYATAWPTKNRSRTTAFVRFFSVTFGVGVGKVYAGFRPPHLPAYHHTL